MSVGGPLLLLLLLLVTQNAHARNRRCIPSDLNGVCGCANPSDTVENCFAENPGRVVVMDGYTICDLDDSTDICNTDQPEGWLMGAYSFIAPQSTLSSQPLGESSCCVPCTKTTLACPESSLAFASATGAGLCALVSGEPVEGSTLTISSWQVIGSVAGTPPNLNPGWTGDFTLTSYAVLDGVISKFFLQRTGGYTVTLIRSDDCTYSLNFLEPDRKRQQNSGSVAVLGGPAQLGENGGALGDPHLRSPTGIKYDFDGQANGIYSLFIAPQFQVNMLLAANGPVTRYMTEIGLVFGDLALKFDAFHLTLNPAQRAQLAKLGGRAFSRSRASLTLELCSGHEVTLTVHHTTTAPVMNYFNVEVVTPGCLDAFGGALGQTYTCKHVVEDVPFVWNHVDEESFRVPSLTHRSDGATTTMAPCNNLAFEGQSSMLGSLNH